MNKPDQERLKKIISIWSDLKSEIAQHKITKEKLMDDQFSQWAVTTPLYNIGEHVYQLSKELKQEYHEIPWSMVSGLRHRLVHDYEALTGVLSSMSYLMIWIPLFEKFKKSYMTLKGHKSNNETSRNLGSCLSLSRNPVYKYE